MLLSLPPWENSRTATPTASSTVLPVDNLAQRHAETFSTPLPPTHNPLLSNTPSQARSTGDILHDEKSKTRAWHVDTLISNTLKDSIESSRDSATDTVSQTLELADKQKESKERES